MICVLDFIIQINLYVVLTCTYIITNNFVLKDRDTDTETQQII